MLNKFVFVFPYMIMAAGLYWLKSAWLAFLAYHAFILFVLWKEGKKGDLRLLVNGWSWKVGLGALVFGLVGGVLVLTLAPFAGIHAESLSGPLSSLGLVGVWWLLFVCYHFLVNPWFEELYWRKIKGSKTNKISFGDVAFAGYHVLVLNLFLNKYWTILGFVILIIAAWFWRFLARRYKGFLMPVISHMAADASIMWAVYVLSQ